MSASPPQSSAFSSMLLGGPLVRHSDCAAILLSFELRMYLPFVPRDRLDASVLIEDHHTSIGPPSSLGCSCLELTAKSSSDS